ncbi:MAG: DUF2218 domain-containing protein [Rhodobacteraceae bacterium]|nr:DUF2218 domain-containing protein [Paracoccaceae bacterium]
MALLTGRFTTPNASKYIAQLCKHFAHRIATEHDANTGTAALPSGPASMIAHPDHLEIKIELADEALLGQAKSVIDSHLERFAFREGFSHMEWDR